MIYSLDGWLQACKHPTLSRFTSLNYTPKRTESSLFRCAYREDSLEKCRLCGFCRNRPVPPNYSNTNRKSTESKPLTKIPYVITHYWYTGNHMVYKSPIHTWTFECIWITHRHVLAQCVRNIVRYLRLYCLFPTQIHKTTATIHYSI